MERVLIRPATVYNDLIFDYLVRIGKDLPYLWNRLTTFPVSKSLGSVILKNKVELPLVPE